MSMRNCSCNGYIVKASELIPFLPATVRISANQCLDDGDWESFEEIMTNQWPASLPPFEDVFQMGEEIQTDDDYLQVGEIYVQFARSDLFTLTPTPAYKRLTAKGINIPFRSWVDFG